MINIAKRSAGFFETLERRALLSGGPVGDEFQANTYTAENQWQPAVATDADGDFVVVWQSAGQDGSEWGIFGQRYDAAGAPQGGEFAVNTDTGLAQTDPDVAMDAAGNFIVVWRTPALKGNNAAGSIRARRYAADGTALGDEFHINTPVGGVRLSPRVLMAQTGAFVVTWYGGNETDDYATGIWVRSFDAAGNPIGPETEVDRAEFPNSPREPAAAIDDNGNFAVAWRAVHPGGHLWDVYVRRFSAAGEQMGDDILANQQTFDFQTVPDIAMDAAGNFVVTWQSNHDNWVQDVHARRFSAAGAPLGDEFIVPTHNDGPQGDPAVAMAHDGAFVISWLSDFQDPDASTGVYAQRFDAAGNRLGDEFRLSANFEGPQVHPAVAIDGQGDVVAAWADPVIEDPGLYNYEVLGRTFNVADTLATNVAGDFDNETVHHKLALQFDDDVVTTLTRGDITVVGVGGTVTPPANTFALAYDPTTHLATLNYNATGGSALPEGRYRATIPAAAVTDVIGNRLAHDFVLDFSFLRGDATGDGRVNLDDFNVLAANFGRSGATFSQGDFNYDGRVNLEDFNILASRFGTALAPPAGAPEGLKLGDDTDGRGDELLA